MPAVPYQPVPQIAPTEQAAPGVHLNTPEAAFGGAVAAATEGLGHVTEQAGNELFGRAVALQQLQNETEARDADAQYMIQAGDIHAKYNALEGKARVDAFPQYAQDLQDLRLKLRGGLSNQMAAKMYDSSSLSTMGRSIFNGAGAAATANKEWAHSTVTAQSDLVTKQVYDDPNDEGAFRAAIDQNHQTAATKAALSPGGASPERVALLTKQGDSTIAANRILGMARNQPYQASQLLKQYKDEGLLFGKDYEVVSNKVQSLTQTVGTDTITHQVLAKYLQQDGTFSKSAADMRAEAVTQATKAYPDDPKMESATISSFDRNYSAHSYVQRQDELQVKQQTADYIMKGATNTNQLPPDLVKRMSPVDIKDFPAKANSYQRAEQVQTDQKQYRDLLGLYNNDNGKFMDTDIMRQPGISKSNMDFFLGLQRKQEANGDPRVSRAMNQLKGYQPQVLTDLGIIGPKPDLEAKNQFVGALHEAIQSYQETNGKPPDEKTLTKEIFPAITRQVTEPGFFSIGGYGTTNQTPFFQAGVPEKYVTIFKAAKPEATESEIRQTYTRQMFDQFFKSQKATKDQSRVQ